MEARELENSDLRKHTIMLMCSKGRLYFAIHPVLISSCFSSDRLLKGTEVGECTGLLRELKHVEDQAQERKQAWWNESQENRQRFDPQMMETLQTGI